MGSMYWKFKWEKLRSMLKLNNTVLLSLLSYYWIPDWICFPLTFGIGLLWWLDLHPWDYVATILLNFVIILNGGSFFCIFLMLQSVLYICRYDDRHMLELLGWWAMVCNRLFPFVYDFQPLIVSWMVSTLMVILWKKNE